jgi:uncharacterized protein (UPF0332 family)
VTVPREQYEPYERKAAQSLAGAQSELAAGRYDNAVALAYYACFQMAVAVMTMEGEPVDRRSGFSHGFAIDSIDRVVAQAGQHGLIGKAREVYMGRLNAQYRPMSSTRLTGVDLLDHAYHGRTTSVPGIRFRRA